MHFVYKKFLKRYYLVILDNIFYLTEKLCIQNLFI